MEHPGLDLNKIKEESIEDIQTTLKELIMKLNFAYQRGDTAMINQLNMARETYTRAQLEKLTEMFGDDKDNAQGQIDIS